MPYRSGARPALPDTIVPCEHCGYGCRVVGAEVSVGTVVGCERCSRETRPLRPAGDLGARSLSITSAAESSVYAELLPFAQSLGKDVGATQMDLEVDGMVCTISISLNSGTVTGLDMVAHTSGLPTVRLVAEGGGHREWKNEGVSREVQTGDPRFDDAVYLESSMDDDAVRAPFASPAVREAVMSLVGTCQSLVMDKTGVSVSVERDNAAFDVALLRGRLELLRVVAGAPRALAAREIPLSRAARTLKLVTYVAGPIGLLLTIVGGLKYAPLAWTPILLALLAGLVLAALLFPVHAAVLRGRSTSHREITVARGSSLVFTPLLVLGSFLVVNGVLDTSPETRVPMRVVSTATDSDGDAHVEVVDSRGDTYRFKFGTFDPAKEKIVHVRLRQGALGVRWESGPAYTER